MGKLENRIADQSYDNLFDVQLTNLNLVVFFFIEELYCVPNELKSLLFVFVCVCVSIYHGNRPITILELAITLYFS